MKCPNCGGEIEFDKDNVYKFCPYCGSKGIQDESDEVVIERIKANKDLEKQKMKQETKEKENRNWERDRRIFGTIFMVVFIVIVVVSLIRF